MNDLELLEAAAKAAGKMVEADGVHSFDDWNPLTNDGDAFRLAVQLGLRVHFDQQSAGKPCGLQSEWLDDTMSDAELTRRAIVMAAATMGKDYKA